MSEPAISRRPALSAGCSRRAKKGSMASSSAPLAARVPLNRIQVNMTSPSHLSPKINSPTSRVVRQKAYRPASPSVDAIAGGGQGPPAETSKHSTDQSVLMQQLVGSLVERQKEEHARHEEERGQSSRLCASILVWGACSRFVWQSQLAAWRSLCHQAPPEITEKITERRASAAALSLAAGLSYSVKSKCSSALHTWLGTCRRGRFLRMLLSCLSGHAVVCALKTSVMTQWRVFALQSHLKHHSSSKACSHCTPGAPLEKGPATLRASDCSPHRLSTRPAQIAPGVEGASTVEQVLEEMKAAEEQESQVITQAAPVLQERDQKLARRSKNPTAESSSQTSGAVTTSTELDTLYSNVFREIGAVTGFCQHIADLQTASSVEQADLHLLQNRIVKSADGQLEEIKDDMVQVKQTMASLSNREHQLAADKINFQGQLENAEKEMMLKVARERIKLEEVAVQQNEVAVQQQEVTAQQKDEAEQAAAAIRVEHMKVEAYQGSTDEILREHTDVSDEVMQISAMLQACQTEMQNAAALERHRSSSAQVDKEEAINQATANLRAELTLLGADKEELAALAMVERERLAADLAELRNQKAGKWSDLRDELVKDKEDAIAFVTSEMTQRVNALQEEKELLQTQLLDAQRSLSNAATAVGKASREEQVRWAGHENKLVAGLTAEHEAALFDLREQQEIDSKTEVDAATKQLHDAIKEAKQREHEAVWKARDQMESQKDQISVMLCHVKNESIRELTVTKGQRDRLQRRLSAIIFWTSSRNWYAANCRDVLRRLLYCGAAVQKGTKCPPPPQAMPPAPVKQSEEADTQDVEFLYAAVQTLEESLDICVEEKNEQKRTIKTVSHKLTKQSEVCKSLTAEKEAALSAARSSHEENQSLRSELAAARAAVEALKVLTHCESSPSNELQTTLKAVINDLQL